MMEIQMEKKQMFGEVKKGSELEKQKLYKIIHLINFNNFLILMMMPETSMVKTGSYMYSQGDQNNPQTPFSKLLGIPQDTPIREWKMLLDTMKEQCLFEKNIIKNTASQIVPRHIFDQRSRTDNFRNYQRLLTYSKKKQDIELFQRRSQGRLNIKVKKNKAQTLKEFMTDKKVRMLTENNKYSTQDRVVESILKDDRAREKLFDESILMERLYYVKKQQKKYEQQSSKFPAKFKGLNPKHLRLPQSCYNQNSFHRRKYVHNQRTFQYFRNAIKTQNNMLKVKQKQNSLVIKNLMSNFSQQILNSKDDDINKIHKCIHRLFLKYANNDSEDINKMYKFISKEKLIVFFREFGIEYEWDQKLNRIIMEKEINQFYFLEILHLLSLKEGNIFQSDMKRFFEEKILSRPQLYLPTEWNLFQKHRNFISKHSKVRRFREKLEFLHDTFIKNKSFSNRFNFDQMVQIMWLLKIYPFMISKKKLRFFYLYCQNEDSGLTINDIADIYLYIALSRQGQAEQNIREIIGIVVQFSKIKKQ